MNLINKNLVKQLYSNMAAQAAAAAGTAAVDIGKGLFNNMEARKGAESARSCQVAIRNLTNETLIRAHRQCNYGEWTKENEAPAEIPGRDAGGFMFESHGLMTGCGGEANYEIGTTGEALKVFVSVPYSQANETRAKIEGGSRFKVTTEGGNGKNVTYTIKLGRLIEICQQ